MDSERSGQLFEDPPQESSGFGASSSSSASAVEWAVGAVSDRLGLSPATLRTWDRRYGVGPSQRTDGGHRRYSEEDIRRVRVMARFTARGVPAQSAARVALSMDSDRLLIETGAEEAAEVPRGDDLGTVEAICSAALSLDPGMLSKIYQRTLRERDLVAAWTHVFAPALRTIGDQWGAGSLGVESEHLASEILVSELRSVIRANRPRNAHSEAILACADDEQHYLPLLALEAELARHGVGALGLGARVPTQALQSLLLSRRPSRLFLWASISRAVDEQLWSVLDHVRWPLALVLGGPGWPDDLPLSGRWVSVTRASDLAGATQALLAPLP
jgi:DNA-binding transcriptional MerR regulator